MRSRRGDKDHGGTPATPRMLCCPLVFLAVFLCLQQICYFWGSSEKKVIMMGAVEKYRNGSEPQALLYPVWWYAPFFTGSGEEWLRSQACWLLQCASVMSTKSTQASKLGALCRCCFADGMHHAAGTSVSWAH
jgi:hypothetical protein